MAARALLVGALLAFVSTPASAAVLGATLAEAADAVELRLSGEPAPASPSAIADRFASVGEDPLFFAGAPASTHFPAPMPLEPGAVLETPREIARRRQAEQAPELSAGARSSLALDALTLLGLPFLIPMQRRLSRARAQRAAAGAGDASPM